MACFIFYATKFAMPFLKHVHKARIQPPADDFNERTASFHGEPERGDKHDDKNHLVLPAVQFPLMFPKPNGMTEQRFGVANWPQVADGRAARADQIAKQMKVECK